MKKVVSIIFIICLIALTAYLTFSKAPNKVSADSLNTDSLQVIPNDTMYLFSDNIYYTIPFANIKNRKEFEDKYNCNASSSCFSHNDTLFKYDCDDSHLNLFYDEKDEDEDSVYTYVNEAVIKDQKFLICDEFRVGMSLEELQSKLNWQKGIGENIQVLCLVCMLDTYYYYFSLENGFVSSISIVASDILPKEYKDKVTNLYDENLQIDK
ncbi:MAG: hypothetical protein IJ916_13360 [Paludibacteraceae bacterium]|nr:hypothetical protein [Paludibacteraceae bacterium]MEE3485459.1 hypothetical protein [Bacteroidales bacterium]